jgi:vancomycin resistance protein YoaR
MQVFRTNDHEGCFEGGNHQPQNVVPTDDIILTLEIEAMNSTQTLPGRSPDVLSLATRTLLMLFTAGLVLVVSAGIFLLGTRIFFFDRALPGVHATGIDLGGMNQEEIENALSQILTYPQTGLIVLYDGDSVWTAQPTELGVLIDIPAMARQALAVGRQGNVFQRFQEQIDTWYLGHPIAPIVIFDQLVGGHYLQGLARGIDRPTLEASLAVDGTEILVQPGQIGRRLDIQATLDALIQPITHLLDAETALYILETPPLVLDASEQADIARDLLSQPLSLTAEDGGPWIIEPSDLADMLRFNLIQKDGETRYEVILDPPALMAILEPISSDLIRQPENARFIFNDDTRQLDLLQSATIGRSLDIPATIEAIKTGLNLGQHEMPLIFHLTEPAVVDEATAAELGISEAVSDESTYFTGSSAERIQNIKTASSAFHGLLVAPGETLSMAEVLGDISLDNGYAEALIIYGDRTIKGVGGGVCQVSTTLFRAVFFGGYPIDERHPHAYRVMYYEQGPDSPGTGLDATVFVPMVDLKFTNDTPYWLLLETYTYNNRLQWKFYSTSDDRSVQWSSHTSNEVEAPEPLYKENLDLEEGEIKQVDYNANGLDVVVYRTVTRDGEVLYQDTIKTHYLPWRAIYEYGPGAEIPEDAKTE